MGCDQKIKHHFLVFSAMRASLFLVFLIVFVQFCTVSNGSSPFIVGMTWDIDKTNYLVTLDPETGLV